MILLRADDAETPADKAEVAAERQAKQDAPLDKLCHRMRWSAADLLAREPQVIVDLMRVPVDARVMAEYVKGWAKRRGT